MPFGVSDDAVPELPDESGVPHLVGYDLRAAGEEITISFLPARVLGFDFGVGFLESFLPIHVREGLYGEFSLIVVLLNIELLFMKSFVDEASCMLSRCSW